MKDINLNKNEEKLDICDFFEIKLADDEAARAECTQEAAFISPAW